MKRVELIAKFLFDLPSGNSQYNCSDEHVCNQDSCYTSMKNMSTWEQFNGNCEHSRLFESKKSMLDIYQNVMESTISSDVKTKSLESRYNYTKLTVAVRNSTHEECPAQESLSPYHLIRMSFELTSEVFMCGGHNSVDYYKRSSYGCGER